MLNLQPVSVKRPPAPSMLAKARSMIRDRTGQVATAARFSAYEAAQVRRPETQERLEHHSTGLTRDRILPPTKAAPLEDKDWQQSLSFVFTETSIP